MGKVDKKTYNEGILANDFYVISDDFRLVSFNESVRRNYEGIKVGDYCYKATMKRDEPCLHCPIAGNSNCDCPVYYDPFYKSWIEAIFSNMGNGQYAVCCRPAKDRGLHVFDELGKDDNEELIKKVAGYAVNDRLFEMQRERNEREEEIAALNDQLQYSQYALRERNDELQRQLSVIESISQRYFCAYWVDVNSCTFKEVFTIPNMHQLIGSEGDALAVLDAGWRALVVEEDKPIMQDFHNLSKWKERLRDTNSYSREYRGVTSGWSRATIFSGQRDEDGEVTHVVYTLEEIHDQKAAEMAIASHAKEIEKLNRKLQSVNKVLEERMSVIQSIIKVYSSAYYIDLVEDNYVELSSTDDIHAGAANMSEAQNGLIYVCEHLIHEDSRDTIRKFTDLSTLSLRLEHKDFISAQYMNKNGRWSQMFFIAGEKDADGRLVSVIFCTRNINEEKEAEIRQKMILQEAREQAEVASKAKTAFLFNMSHDIRTPMNAIMGFRTLLEKHQDDPVKRADYLKKIEQSSNVLLSIIDNVLEMARIEKGTIEIDENAWSAEQFNDTLFFIFQEMMAEKNIKFERELSVRNKYVYCDPIKLREVFINILSNAYKYTNAGGCVSMRLVEIPSDREGYAVYQTTITDNGIGMSEDFLPHIFEEFSRENNTTDNKIEGTGLGMPIVKRLVEIMNGTIEAKSVKGEGSTFIVTIPHRIAERSSHVEHENVEVDPKLFEGKRVLLTEDNDLNAEIAIEILESAGFIVERAADGRICCQKLEDAEEHYYDLILMDIQMPNMNGYEATRNIRKMQDSAKAVIPIIAMTANAFEEDKRDAFKAGMNEHITKPIDVAELMKAVARIIG